MKKLKLKFHKITHWEYWSFDIVYIPMYLVWMYYAAKARSFFFFNASNPSIKNAGFLMESKKEIYDILPKEYIPKTILFKYGTSAEDVLKVIESSNISFPCIAKPDIGAKGQAVQKIEEPADIVAYLAKICMNFLIQEFIDLPYEVGIFYCRLPDEQKGKITGIVAKEFLIVKGDGVSSITSLLMKNPRHFLQLGALEKIYGNDLNKVLEKDEQKNLVPYGNHARGAKFVDVSFWADEKFNNSFDLFCKQVPEFYYGRLDVMYNTLEELKEGKNFKVIELNGAGSEPTHIYDPKHSVFFAWKEIARHFKILYNISIKNHKRGYPYLTNKEGLQMFKENKEVMKKLKAF